MTEIDEVELLNLAAIPIPKKEKEVKKSKIEIAQELENCDTVLDFIVALRMKEGPNKINNADVYEAYCLWATHPLPNTKFFKAFAKKLTPQRDRNGRYYNLDKPLRELRMECEYLKAQREKDKEKKQEI